MAADAAHRGTSLDCAGYAARRARHPILSVVPAAAAHHRAGVHLPVRADVRGHHRVHLENFKPHLGIIGSDWVGLRHFIRFFESPSFWRLIRNTIFLSGYELLVGFPIPIILALMMNMVTGGRFKRTVQMVTYAPHFISTVVIVGMLGVFLSKNFGLANHFIDALGGQRLFFLGREQWFRSLYVFSGVWQNAGWGTIIYLAALNQPAVRQPRVSRHDFRGRGQ